MNDKKADKLLIQNIIGKHVKANRQKLNLTQQELAELSQITTRNLGKIEYGDTLPNAQTLTNLIIALNMDPKEYIEEFRNKSKHFNKNSK